MALDIALLKTPYEISFSGNPIPFSLAVFPYTSAEQALAIRVQISIKIEIGFNSNVFQEIKNQAFYPTAEGLVTIDVQSFIDPYLKYLVPKPDLSLPVDAREQSRRYKISYLLMQGNDVVVASQDSAVFTALKGGMAYDQWHPSEFFTDYLFAQKNFLSFSAKGEKLALDQAQFLFFLAPVADNYGVIFFVTDQDGAVHQITTNVGVQLSRYGVGCIPAGYNQVDELRTSGIAYCVSYTANVVSSSGDVICTKKFVVDHRNFYDVHHLLYRNSAGGLETVRLRGQVDFEADYNRQTALRTVPPSYFANLNLMAQQVDTAEEQPKYKGDTGFISKAAAEKLRDLFLAPEKWEIKDGKLFPISLITKNTKFFSNQDSLITTQVEWQRAYVNNFYTPSGIMPSVRTCPAVVVLRAKQVGRSKLQIVWALVTPYDTIEVEITIGGNTYTYTFAGNVGSIIQPFVNPVTNAPLPMTIKARTVCDGTVVPVNYGPYTTINLNIIGNSLPVVGNDTYNLSSGAGPFTVTDSVLANDYDPDGDAIEAVIVTGATAAGGIYSMNTNGIFAYQPPSPTFTGQDWFDYQVREVGGTTTVTGRVFLNVGTGLIGVVFAKVVLRNVVIQGPVTNGQVWLDFYANAAGTQALNVTPLNLTFNFRDYEKNFYINNSGQEVIVSQANHDSSRVGSGTSMKIFDGLLRLESISYTLQHSWSLLPGTGYTAI